jgi:hypothetical protein
MTDPAITGKACADHRDRLRKRLTELRAEAVDRMVRRGTVGLTLYGEAGAIASMALDPVRAIALTGKLIRAALPRLSTRSR